MHLLKVKQSLMEIVEFDMASPFFFLSRMIGSLHVFTNLSDGYESSSDQESYSKTSSGKLSKVSITMTPLFLYVCVVVSLKFGVYLNYYR